MTAELTMTPGILLADKAAETTMPPMLSLSGVRVSYGESVVLHDVALDVEPGQIVCLMGRNGAGKTTLMKSIMGTLPLRGGSISVLGSDMRGWPPYKRARAGIGYVPQGRGIFPYLTVMENILIGLEPLKGRDEGQVDEVLTLFPVLREMQGRTAGLLSGGQQQQLAIARVLVARPKLLLMDEPTEGVQPSIVDMIQDVISSLRGKYSVLLVEQFLDFALDVADLCYVIESGRIVLEGAPAILDRARLHEHLSV